MAREEYSNKLSNRAVHIVTREELDSWKQANRVKAKRELSSNSVDSVCLSNSHTLVNLPNFGKNTKVVVNKTQ